MTSLSIFISALYSLHHQASTSTLSAGRSATTSSGSGSGSGSGANTTTGFSSSASSSFPSLFFLSSSSSSTTNTTTTNATPDFFNSFPSSSALPTPLLLLLLLLLPRIACLVSCRIASVSIPQYSSSASTPAGYTQLQFDPTLNVFTLCLARVILETTFVMDSFIHVAGWSQHLASQPRRSGRPLSGHFRSLSSNTASTTPSSPSTKPRIPIKSPSTSQLPSISLNSTRLADDEMSTLPDPRSRRVSDSGQEDSATDSPTHHPDLNDEVATLSTKLINAINHQTALDDTLSATRHELQTARDHIRLLESQNASQREMMAGEVWVRRSTLDGEKKKMQDEKRSLQHKLDDEIFSRLQTEQEKRKIEQELENLTAALFEEANKMVIGAKEEAQQQHDALQRKNDQLKSQLEDSEALLKSQQEQLSELKCVMETMAIDRDDQTNVTAPSSPGATKFDSNFDDRSPIYDSAVTSPIADCLAPAPPTSFQHLVQPVLRHDLNAYEDFIGLARQSHKRAGSRISSGSTMGGLAALSLGLGGSTSSSHPNNASTTSLTIASATSGGNSAPQSPNTPGSSTYTTPNTNAPLPSLKETKFYKRALVEDIEPTLRLDAAPGLSWLARRSVLSAVTEGNLVVEPLPVTISNHQVADPHYFPCSLCGDSRKETPYLRNHNFRINETDAAQRYPLCGYCLARVRSTCGFLGFLRMIKDGHWRADDPDHEKTAWEESVRLREQMFWSRIGGGVVPTSQADMASEGIRSGRPSHDRPAAERLNVDMVTNEPASSIDDKITKIVELRPPVTPPEQTEKATNERVSTISVETQSDAGTESTTRQSTIITT